MKKTSSSVRNTKRIPCAFCHGAGRDPFDQLYRGSVCQVCSGRREMVVALPYKNCAYCHGSGVEFGTQNTCTVCLGRGVISKSKNLSGKTCSLCMGTGMNMENNLPCIFCQGSGWL